MSSLVYIVSENIYLGKFGSYTYEEIENADYLEFEWKKTQKKYGFYQLLEIFPQAKTTIKRNLIEEIKQCRQNLENAHQLYNEYTYKIIPQTRKENQEQLFAWRDATTARLREGCEKRIKRNRFYLSALKSINLSQSDNQKITPGDIERAKNVPLDTLVEINRSGFARCPFHEDRNPSLRVYKNENRWYCFSCNAGSDMIDLYMKLNKCDFIKAVKRLIGK